VLRSARGVASCVVAVGLSSLFARPSLSRTCNDAATYERPILPDTPAEHADQGVPRCEALRERILDRAMDPFGSVDRAEQERLVRDVRLATTLDGASVSETCAATVIRELAAAPRCGSAADLISSAAAEANALDPQLVETFRGRASSCQRAIVGGLAQLRRPQPSAADTLLAWTLRQRDPLGRAGGFVVLGSVANTLRNEGELGAFSRAEDAIRRELQYRTKSLAVWSQRLEAAGNTGCDACLPMIARALSADSAGVRRAAAGALRFVTDLRAPNTMCDALLNDRDASVRDQAAWALKWSHVGSRERVACLTASAARDPTARVRQTAALSLAQLATSDSLAEAALLHLSSEEYDGNVRRIALTFLDGDRRDIDVAGEAPR
jgi:hypothetical protein